MSKTPEPSAPRRRTFDLARNAASAALVSLACGASVLAHGLSGSAALALASAGIFGILAAVAFARLAIRQPAPSVIEGGDVLGSRLEQLEQLVKVSPFMIALYDAEQTLIVCSDTYSAGYSHIWQTLKQPVSYPDLVRASAIHAGVPAAELERYVASRVAAQVEGNSALADRKYPNGTWQRVAKVKLADNAVAGFAVDITELRKSEERLISANKQLETYVGEQLPRAIGNLENVSQQLQSAASDVTTLSGNAHDRIDALSSVAHELSASITEISRNSSQAAAETQRVCASASDIEKRIGALDATLAKIANFAGTISSIAGQTNLLALNATIEAARAGEAGRGFSVVASEVKQLAEQSGRASQEIGGQLQSIQNAARDVGNAIVGIVSDVGSISERITMIATASSQQAAASEHVNQNLLALVNVAVETGEASRLVSKAAENADEVSKGLRSSIAAAHQIAA